MARLTITARFADHDAARRACAELAQTGLAPADIGSHRDDGARVLTVSANEADGARVLEILRRHAPNAMEDDAGSVTLSGAPADHAASPGGLPDADSPSDWLVREEGELAADVDPDDESKHC
jgi:hypothetical protein